MKNLTTFLMVLATLGLGANNIQISNTKLTGQNTAEGYTLVQFDLSWENSWRTSSAPNNWDAAWVFVKYRITAANGGDDLWKHARLHNNGHSGGTGTGATIDVGLLTPGNAFDANTNPGIGIFIYRSANGTGAFSVAGAQLRWNYSANGVADDDLLEIKVFAIEMVYVPQGAFAAGSGGSESSAFTLTTINTANATTAPAGTGGFNGSAQGGYPTGQTAPANASWPNGYSAFYCMKYETTQQQYVDFLNTLTLTQMGYRRASQTGYRHDIKICGVAYCTTNPYVACNYLSWMDGAAYADWAGLRPMTELEFEKACRGTVAPVADEYAWGTIEITQVTGINNSGAANETAANSGNGLSVHGNHGSVQGPLRVGALATSSTTIRQASGASYYGIMELSGNLWERAVTVGNDTGRDFTGVHGDGALSTNGNANETAWPGLSSGEVTDATGSGFRGGHWFTFAAFMRVSERFYATGSGTARNNVNGFRCVRVVP